MSDPRFITGEVEFLNNEVSIKFMNCDCPAGTSHSCKHIAAILFYLNRNDIRQLETISSTDIKCLWKQQKGPSTEKFKPLPWKTFCCFKQGKQHNFSEIEEIEIRETFIKIDEKYLISRHNSRKRKHLTVLTKSKIACKSSQINITPQQHLSHSKIVINNACKSEEM
ncbi:hypothetical protein PV327_011174, partial [Microctonus hyperodae]